MDGLNDGAQQTREQLLDTLHEAGIDAGTPLGVLFKVQADALINTRVSMKQTVAALEEMGELSSKSLAQSEQAMQDLTAQLQKSFEAVRNLYLSTENRIKEHERRLDQQYAQIVDKSVASVMKDLKREVFDALRQRLPLQEGAFYYMARWHFFMKLTLGILFFVLLGSGLTAVAGWHAYSRGVYCFGHTLRNEQGQAWCALDPLFNHTAERTETDQEK